MEEMQITSALTWIEVQFMKKAVEEVDKCRTTLKWTYAMAYYLAKGNEKDLFEDNQRSVFLLFSCPFVESSFLYLKGSGEGCRRSFRTFGIAHRSSEYSYIEAASDEQDCMSLLSISIISSWLNHIFRSTYTSETRLY